MTRYRSDIDGLRAVAVVPVILYHAHLGLNGGFVGVDVFFVISGFLITSLIKQEIEESRFTIVDFYERRARRILPALFAVLTATVLLTVPIFLPVDFKGFGASVAATALFSSNFYFWHTAGYFEGAAELKPLLHTWSLAVEEQYYVAFPLLMIVIAKFGRRKYSPWLSGLALASFAASVWCVFHQPTAAFYLLPFRGWELLLGAMIAVGVFPSSTQRVRDGLSILGFVLLIGSFLWLNVTVPFPGAAALPPCIGAGLLIYAGGASPSLGGRILSWKPLVWIGLLSYSLYLWHWPLLVVARYINITPLSTAQIAAVLVLTGLLSFLSWRFVERPFRRRDRPFGRSALFMAAAAGMTLAVGMGAAVFASGGAPWRLSREVARIAKGSSDFTPYRNRCLYWPAALIAKGELCDVILGDRTVAATSFVLWGDSHADALSPALDDLGKTVQKKGIDATLAGCPPILDATVSAAPLCGDFNRLVLRTIRSRGIGTVILAARWPLYAEGVRYGYYEPGDSVKIGGTAFKGDNAASLRFGLASTLAALQQLHVKTWIVSPVPEQRYDAPYTGAMEQLTGRQASLTAGALEVAARQRRSLAVLTSVANQYGAGFIDIKPFFCGDNACQDAMAGSSLYYDSHHLSTFGAHRLEPFLRKAL